MMKGLPFFVYKERRSLDFGLLIVKKGSYKGAARDVSRVSVPGRSGDLIIDNGRYSNIMIPYQLTLLNKTEYSFESLARQIRGWLLSGAGYFRLWDSYDPNYFRLASYSGEANIEQELKQLGSLSISFDCKPFKYSVEGHTPVIFTQAGSLYNAEQFPSTPYIKVIGNGNITLTINDNRFELRNVSEYIELDFELPNAYKGGEPKNSLVSGADMSSLRLMSGFNSISWTGSVERVEITPRWCTL